MYIRCPMASGGPSRDIKGDIIGEWPLPRLKSTPTSAPHDHDA